MAEKFSVLVFCFMPAEFEMKRKRLTQRGGETLSLRTRVEECSRKFTITRAMLKVPPEIENQGDIMTTADALGMPNKSLRCHRVKDVTWTQKLGVRGGEEWHSPRILNTGMEN